MNECSRKERPRFKLLVNERMAKEWQEELQRQAAMQRFIKACEMLYEKNRARQV